MDQEQLMGAVSGFLHRLTLSELAGPSFPASPGPVSEPRVGEPERYGGDPDGCDPFLTNC